MRLRGDGGATAVGVGIGRRPETVAVGVRRMSVDPKGSDIAAVDLGSNSFHMVVARLVEGQVHVVDRIRERVALAAGLDDAKRLSEEAQEKALACVERFGQRLGGVPRGLVRAVGTNTLRVAKNARSFIGKAEKALGHPIEIIPGREEARLIYLGVSHSLPNEPGRRLVIDIGGGSTECILGERFEPVQTDSLYMGCVSYSLKYFSEGKITEDGFRRAEIAARLELESIARRYRSLGWDQCAGSSGTIQAVDDILRANEWSDRGITEKGLKKLTKAFVEAGRTSKLTLPGLQEDRAPVIPGGLAILSAVFSSLDIDRMTPAAGALREGLLYDLLGRIRSEDVRDRTIKWLTERYRVEMDQASRVERTAIYCFDQVASAWGLDQDLGRKLLSWAARLHEIGLSVSYAGYHRHGAYLVANSDMPGFSREDQQALAILIQGHRRKLADDLFEANPPLPPDVLKKLCAVIRLAVRLHRSRSAEPLPPIRLRAEPSGLHLTFPEGWLDAHPLTAADFEEEAGFLKAVGFDLSSG